MLTPALRILTPILIYLVLPIIGVAAFLQLLARMRDGELQSPPSIPLFVLFFTLGGWLQVILTAAFWEWSGMATIGMLYLVFIAPILTGFMTLRLRRRRLASKFHNFAFLASAAYTVTIPVAAIIVGISANFIGD